MHSYRSIHLIALIQERLALMEKALIGDSSVRSTHGEALVGDHPQISQAETRLERVRRDFP